MDVTKESNGSIVSAKELIHYVCQLSVYACRIAKFIRSDPTLLQLLTQEKRKQVKGENIPDFKTLADVLIQVRLHHFLVKKYPALSGSVFGEETTKFTSASGNQFQFSTESSLEETISVLTELFDGNIVASNRLAKLIHESPDVEYKTSNKVNKISDVTGTVDVSKLGVWIDPIDGTSSYIHGGRNQRTQEGLLLQRCLGSVCVLIGGFNLETGDPVFGAVGCPFDTLEAAGDLEDAQHSSKLSLMTKGAYEVWRSKLCWSITPFGSEQAFHGSFFVDPEVPIPDEVDANNSKGQPMLDVPNVHDHTKKLNNAAPDEGTATSTSAPKPIILHGKHEPQVVLDRLIAEGFNMKCSPSAGFKLLCVHEGYCSAWICSLPSTYKWDTCAGHAVLCAKGGDVVGLDGKRVKYNQRNPDSKGDKEWANSQGIIASIDPELRDKLVGLIQSALA